MARQTIDSQIEKARVIVNVALNGDAALRARLTQVGYDNVALGVAQTLVNSFDDIRTNVMAQRGDKRGATDTVYALRTKVETQYNTLAQIARTIFAKNNDALTTLGLLLPKPPVPTAPEGQAPEAGVKTSRRPSRTQAAILDRCRLLYRGALTQPDILAELVKVGYTEARLDTEWEDVQALEQADITQESHKGDSKGITAEQRARLTELNEWVSRFTGIVVPALKDRPEMLSKLGLKPRGPRH